jgi:hypothetical protein
MRPGILRCHRVNTRRRNLHVLNLRHAQPVAPRARRSRHRDRAVAHRPRRARPRRPRQSVPARRKNRVRSPSAGSLAHASCRRPPLRRRARNIHALVHINRQIVQPRVAQNIRRVRPVASTSCPGNPISADTCLPNPPIDSPCQLSARVLHVPAESSAPRRAHSHNSALPAARSYRRLLRRTPRRTPSRCAPPAARQSCAGPSLTRRSDS